MESRGSLMPEVQKTRSVSWIKAALKEFRTFPEGVQSSCLVALAIAADGGKADLPNRCRASAPVSRKSRDHSGEMPPALSLRCN